MLRDKELKLEEIEVSHTLCGAGEGRTVVCRGEGSGDGVDATPGRQMQLSDTVRYINLTEGRHMPGWVAWTNAPVCICERVGTVVEK